MKFFISYSHQDKKFVNKLVEKLKSDKIKVTYDTVVDKLNVGDNIFDKIGQEIKKSDYVIPILSPEYLRSGYTKFEFDIFKLQEVQNKKDFLIPILLKDSIIPSDFTNRRIFDFRKDFENGYQFLLSFLKELNKGEEKSLQIERDNTREIEIMSKLQKKFQEGKLTLFCGAGISVEAGIPNWKVLLKELLESLFDEKTIYDKIPLGSRKEFTEIYYKHTSISSLIIGKYLKTGLQNKFPEYVRNVLYKNNPKSCELIDVIIELCRPQREGKPLHSIITFNFDDLIEQNLKANRIKYTPIYSEGQRAKSKNIPVYHVHGYLPQNTKLTKENQIVFSEDAYHSQFIDPFSWSNLVQLNHLSQNSCVLVGLSLTDPNLRRLLDVAHRKNGDKKIRHYIFKKRLSYDEISKKMKEEGLSEHLDSFSSSFIEISELLEERDANELGLGVIWYNDYNEVPKLLNELITDE